MAIPSLLTIAYYVTIAEGLAYNILIALMKLKSQMFQDGDKTAQGALFLIK